MLSICISLILEDTIFFTSVRLSSVLRTKASMSNAVFCCKVLTFLLFLNVIFIVLQFGHGQSNPTFLIEVHSGTLAKRYVLRKKPHGTLLTSAHAVEREYKVVVYSFFLL